MKLTITDLIMFAVLFIAGLAFAQLAVNALDKEELGRQEMIQRHNFNLKYGE